MPVVKMQQISICALRTKRKAIMEELQRRGVIEISPLKCDGDVFVKEETAQQQSLFMKNSASAAKAYEIMLRYFPEKSSMLDMFKGRDLLSKDEYYSMVEKSLDIMRSANDVIALDKGLSEKRAGIAKYEYQIEALLPWKSLDISMRFKGTESSAAFIGTFPEMLNYEQILLKIAEQNPNISSAEVEVISS